MPPPLGARAHLYALLGYFALALVVTWPLALYFTQSVPGDLIADRDQNLWNLCWAREAFLRPTNPFWTDVLYHPYGAPLYYHTLGLPLGAIGLLPQLLLGLPAAYNTVLLAAFTLSGYGAFRLAILFTPSPLAAFLGGIVYAFTPYTLDALKGQTEVLSVQWLPFYAEAWIRAQRAGQLRYLLLAGVLLAVTALSSLYYAFYALLFTVAHLIYTLIHPRISPQSAIRNLAITFGIALTLTLPLVWGLLTYRNDPRLDVTPDHAQKLTYSADLLSFFVPPADHPFVGNPPRPGATPPPLHSYLSLGYVALGLSILGATLHRNRKAILFWGALGLTALVLSLGPELQVAGNRTGVPMPYKLLEWLPGWDSVAKIERLVVLARLCMGVLAALGAGWLLGWLGKKVSHHFAGLNYALPLYRRILPFAAILALLLVELPIHPRYIEPLYIPPGYNTLAAQPGDDALMELPFATRQAETLGRRMLFQTLHGRPIMGGYLARSYGSPIADTCSPFWGFISVRQPASDIISPTLVSRPLDVLRFYNIGYISLYETYGGPQDEPLDSEEREAFMDIISNVTSGAPLYHDSYVSIYKVDRSPQPPLTQPLLLMGNNWYEPETSGGQPFRWVSEDTARLCVFSPTSMKASLLLEGTAFHEERRVQIAVGGREVYSGTLATNGVFSPIQIPPLEWPSGMTEITLRSSTPPTTPQSLDLTSADSRSLRVGFRGVSLQPAEDRR